MKSQIDDLIAMRDIETLYEIMTEDDDWLTQFDAAEGLIKLNDRRGYEFVTTAMLSDDEDILDVAKEIQDSPEYRRIQREIESEREGEKRMHLESAHKRLQAGGKVFRYKMVYLSSSAFVADDPMSKGYAVPALDNFGLEGWEIVNVFPGPQAMVPDRPENRNTGAYFLLKKEINANEGAELDNE